MSHGTMAQQSTYPGQPRWKRIQSIILNVLGVLRNRVQQLGLVGTVIPAGGAITLDAALTAVGAGTRVKVSATASFTFPSGFLTPFVTRTTQFPPAPPSGPVTVWQWAQEDQGPKERDIAAVFFDSIALSPGEIATYHWQTSGGDGAATIGGGSAGGSIGACLLVEEEP